jgi:hypothetical protein
MASTAEGITVGDEGIVHDPNDAAGFEAIMAARGVTVGEGEERTPDRSIAGGLTVAGPEQGQARDQETGKFISNQEKTPAPAAPAAATDTPGEGEGDFADPAVQEFLSKYGGNVEEALKGAANAQALIGRRDERTETLEKELAELRGITQGLMARGAAPAAQPLSNEQIVDIASTRIEALGFEGAATEAANTAQTTGDERPLQAVLEQWDLESRFAAMNFLTDFRLWQREQAAAAQAPAEQPAWMQTAAEQVAVDSLTQVITSVAAERGVKNDSPIIEQMLPALEKMPKNVLDMVNSSDSEAVAEGVRLVMDRATVLAGQAAAAAPPAEQTATGTVARKLAGAAVASAALRPAPPAAAAPTNREDAIKEFKRQIVEAPTTNIASGLTYGPQP